MLLSWKNVSLSEKVCILEYITFFDYGFSVDFLAAECLGVSFLSES